MSSLATITQTLGLAGVGAIVAAKVVRPSRGHLRLPRTDAGEAPIRRRRHRRAAAESRSAQVAVGTATTLAAVWLVGPMVATLLALTVGVVVRSRPLVDRQRARRARVLAVPDALDLVVILLHAGATPRQTFVELGRSGPPVTRPGFAAVALLLGRGHPFGEAVGALRRELGPAVGPFVEMISAAERSGLAAAHLVHQLSLETRALRRRHDEAAARRLPVKLSFPLVMCTLPSFVLLAIAPAVLAALSSLGARAW